MKKNTLLTGALIIVSSVWLCSPAYAEEGDKISSEKHKNAAKQHEYAVDLHEETAKLYKNGKINEARQKAAAAKTASESANKKSIESLETEDTRHITR